MSGIVGIWNTDSEPVEEALLSRLSSTIAHRGPDGCGIRISKSVGMACQIFRVTPESATEIQPLSDSGGRILVFDGRLDNRDELIGMLKDSEPVANDSTDPELILAAYRVAGIRSIEWFGGDFALAIFDANKKQLILARDPIGLRPLYYCRAKETWLFASEIKALLAHPDVALKPNDEELADFFFDRINHQEKTFFEGISSVVPAHHVILTPKGFEKKQYWEFDPTYKVRFPEFEDYAQAYRHLFTQALKRRLRSSHKVSILVSGGLDSSSIFCLAQDLKQKNELPCPDVIGISNLFPEGMPSNEEHFLGEIEKKYNIEIKRIPFWPLGLPRQSAKEVWHIETPFLDELWGSTRRALEAARESGSRSLLTGHWGDQFLFSQSYLVDLFRSLRWRTVFSHLKEYGAWLTDIAPKWFYRGFLVDMVKYHTPQMMRPFLRRFSNRQDGAWFSKSFRALAHNRFERRYLGSARFKSAYAQSFYQEIRAGHGVFCMEWGNKVGAMLDLEMALPFLDRELISFMLSIPGEIHAYKGVPKALLRQAVGDVLPQGIAKRHWKADFTHLVNETMEREFTTLLGRLTDNGRAIRRGYVDPNSLRKSLEPLRAGLLKDGADCRAAWVLWDLLSLELWLEIFFEKPILQEAEQYSPQEVAHEIG